MEVAHAAHGRARAAATATSGWRAGYAARAIVVLAIIAFGVALAAPRWWLLSTDPDEGVRTSISPFGASRIGYDEALYTSSVRQVMDGDFPVRSPYLDGHEDGVAQQSAIWHTATGLLARATGDVFSSLAVVTTLGAIAAFAMLYLLLAEITGSRWAALALIPIVALTIHVFNQADNILALRRWDVLKPVVTIDPEREWHAWLRYPSPVMTLAPFFAGVIALPRAVERGERRWIIGGAAAFALLVYSYVFYWTALSLAMVLWGGWLAIEHDFVSLRRLGVVAAIAGLIALPEIGVLAWNAIDLPADARDRVGLGELGLHTEVYRQLAQRVAVSAMLAVLILWRCGRRERFYVALLAAPIMLAAVTGVIPQPWHFMTQVWGVFAIPAAVAASAALARMIPPARVSAAGAALGAVALVALAYLFVLEVRSVRHTDPAFAMRADEAAAFDWISEHITTDETVVSPSITTNLYLASLTPADEYIGEGGFSRATDAELTERMLRAQAAFGYTEDDAFSRLDVTDASGGFPVNDTRGDAHELERKLERFLAFYTYSFEIAEQAAFDARVETWRPQYRALLGETNVLSAYRADYLYCGPRERLYRGGTPSPGTFVQPAFRQGEVTVYRLTPAAEPGSQPFAGC
jgi:hypothetical protein